MPRKFTAFLLIGLLAGALAACRLPLLQTPTPFVTPTPNQTMTALFAPTSLATLTLPPVATATQLPASPTPADTNTPLPPSPTATPFATITPTPVPERGGGKFEAAYLSTAPKIDGVWDEWTTKAYPAGNVTFGINQWTGAVDLEASFRVGWDDDYLYLAVKILDDTYAQNASGENIFKGDLVELLLDTDLLGDFSSASLSSDDYQLGLSPGKPNVDGEKIAYLWYPSGKAGTKDQVEIAAVRSPGVTRLEAAIPWSLFNVDPQSGQRFGFALSASDNDDTGSNVQQSMTSSARSRTLTNPTTWGELILKR